MTTPASKFPALKIWLSLALAGSAAGWPASLAAQTDAIRENNTSGLSQGAAWSTGTPLTDANIGVWNNIIDGTVPGANTTSVGDGFIVGGLRIENPAVAITIAANTGSLVLGNSSVVTAIDLSAATVDLTIAANTVLATSQTWSIGTGRTLTISGILSGNAGVAKTGNGALTLSGANAYNGTLALNAGTLNIGAAATLQSAVLSLDGGTVSLGTLTSVTLGGLAGTSNLALVNAATPTPAAVALNVGANGQSTSYTGVLSGIGSLIKNGNGELSLGGANTYTGATTVNRGTLAADFSLAGAPAGNIFSATSTLTLNGGDLRFTGAAAATNAQTLSGLTLGAGMAANVGVNLNGAAGLTVNLGNITRGAGSLLNFGIPDPGANITTGTTGTNGVLTGAAGVAFATINNNQWAGVSGGNIVSLSYVTSPDSSSWTAADNVNLSTNPSAPVGNVTINSLILSDDSDFAIDAGSTFTLGTGGLLVTGDGVNTVSGGTLRGSGGTGKELVIIQNNVANPLVVSSIIADNGGATGLTKAGNGVLTLAGANAYTGATTVLRGTLALGASDVLPSVGAMNVTGGTLNLAGFNDTIGALTVTNGGTVAGAGTLNVSSVTVGNGTISANLSSAGGLSMTTPGTMSISSTSTFTGTLTLTNGAIELLPGANLSTAGGGIGTSNNTASVAGDRWGMLVINGGNLTSSGGFTVQSSAPNNSMTSGILLLDGNLTLNAGLTITNSNGQNTQRPWVVVSGGNLVASSITANRISGSTDTVISGGLIVNGGNVTVTGSYLQATNSWAFLTVNGGNFTAANVTLSQTSNSRGGYLLMSSGNFTVTDPANGLIFLNALNQTNSTISFSGGTGNVEKLTLASAIVTTIGSNVNANFTGGEFYIGSGGIVNNGTVAVNMTVNGGLIGAKADWSAAANVPIALGANNATFQAANLGGTAFNITLGGNLSGAGGLIKTGNGMLTLTGTNSYAGTTNVAAGTLQIGNGGSAGSLGAGDATNNGTLIFNRGNALTLSTAVSGGGSVVKQGNGILNITSSNTYTGGTTVSTGTLLVNNTTGSATGTGAVSLAAGASLGGNGTIGGAVTTTTGAIIQPGNSVGTLTVGSLTVASGVIFNYEFNTSPANDLVIVTASDGLVFNGGGFNFFSDGTENQWLVTGTYNLFQFSGNAPANLSALSVLNPVSFLNYSFQNSAATDGFVQVLITSSFEPNTWISTTGGSWGTAGNWNAGVPPDSAIVTFANVLNANSTVTLDGDRVAAGAIIASTLSYTIAQGGGGNLTFSNGASAANITINFGNHTISAPMTFGPAGLLIDIEPASSLAISGSILTTAGALTKTGNGNLSLSGTNAYSGGTILEGGRTTFAALANLGTGDISFNGGALVWGDGNSADISARTVNILGGGAFLDTNDNDVTLAGTIGNNGTGALIKEGNGLLTLAGNNTYTGGTLLRAGAVEFSALDNLGTGGLFFNGGGLRWASGNSADISTRSTLFESGGATFDVNINNVTLAGSIGGGGAGGFIKQGNGVLTLAAAANYTGNTAINAGTLALGTSNALPTGTSVSINDLATFAIGSFSQTIAGLGGFGNVTIATGGNLTLNTAADANLTATITGAGAFTKDGLGNATLLVSSSISGQLALNSGALTLPDGVSLTSGTAVTARNTTAMLVVNGGTFTANGLVTVNSVANINTISGGILISGGEANFNGGLTLNNTAGQNSERPWVVVTGGNLNATNITNARTSGSSSATTGGLIVSGGNVVVQNTYLQANVSWGAMTVNGGNFTAGTYIASQTATGGRGGILQVSSGNFSVTSSANGGFVVANADNNNVNVTFSGGVSSLAALTFAPNATISSGTANLNLTGGSLYIGSGGVMNNGGGTFAANFNASGGVLGATADWTGSVPIALSGAGVTLQAANSQGDAFTYTLAGALTGTSGITKTGAGTVVLAADNSYTGSTTISEGTLQIGNGGSAGSLGGNTTVANNGVLAFARGDNALSVDAVISGTGGLHQIGPGTTSLTAQNTYTGATTISGGTLNINNAAGVGVAGNVSVSSGGALGGTGTVSGVVTVAAGGAVAPGSGGIGTLTVGSLNLADNSFLNLEFSDTPSNDLIVVTTADGLTLGNATVNLYQAGTANPWNVAGTYTFLNFNSTLAPNVSTLEVGNPLYGLAYSFNSTTSLANITIAVVPLTFRWVAPGNGDWGTAANWSENTVPDAAGELVNLLATNTAPTFITLDGSRTIGGVVFASNNPYGIFAGAGALTFDNSGSAGNVSVFLGNNTIDAPIVLGTTHGVVANVGSGARLNVSGNISESASAPLTKTGLGTLALSGNNSHTGGTSLVAGMLALNSPEALGTGPFIIAGGTLANDSGAEIVLTTNNAQQWNADFSFIGPDNLSLGAGAVTLSANRTVTIASGANLGVFGAIGGSGLSLTKAGNGTLVLGGMSTYDGGTWVTAGTLSLATDDALAATAPVTVSGGVLDLQFFSLGVSTLHLTGGNVIGTGVITATSDYDLQSGTITEAMLSGSVGLVKSGAGAVTLAGAANYTGATTVQNGTLVLGGGSNRLPDGAVVTLGGAGNTAVLQLGDSTGSTSQTLSGLVSAGGNVNVVGGSTFASQLTLNISSGDATFSGVLGNGVNNATVVGNAVSLIKDGDGVLELSGNNTFAGGVTINAGTLRVSSGGNLGNVAGTLQILESTLHATAGFNTNRAVSINGLNSTILIDSGVTLTFGTGTLSGFGNLNKTGAGELVLTSTNSSGFIGETIIHAGTITLASSPALQGSTLFYDNQGGAINFDNLTAATLGGLKGAQNLPLPANFTLSVGNDNFAPASYSGVLSGSGASLVKVGSGAVWLTGVNTFTGDVAVANGALRFSMLDNLGAGTGITLNGGSLRWDTGSTVDVSTRTITLSGGDGGFDTNGNDIAFANGVGNGGSGVLQKNGDGTLTLNGVNDYLGATSVRFGTLAIGAAGSVPTSTALEVEFGARFDASLHQDLTVGSLSGGGEVAVANGGNVTVGGNNLSTTFTGTLNAGASTNFIKTGTGRLELSAVLNYGGATNISGGTLAVNSALPAGSLVTVNPGGTLAGSGTVGNVTVAAGGVLAPGNSIGTQTVGNLTWNSNDVLSAQWELSNFDNTADLLSIAGTLTKGAGSVFLFDFQGTGYFSGSEPTSYTLMDFSANSGFTVGDFAYQNLGAGLYGSFLLNANNLQFIVVPEPSAWALLAGAAALGIIAARRRRR